MQRSFAAWMVTAENKISLRFLWFLSVSLVSLLSLVFKLAELIVYGGEAKVGRHQDLKGICKSAVCFGVFYET